MDGFSIINPFFGYVKGLPSLMPWKFFQNASQEADIDRFGWIFQPSEIHKISWKKFSRKDCIFRPSVLGSPNWHSFHTLRLRSSRSEVDSLTRQLPHDRIRSSTQRTMLIVAKLLGAQRRYIFPSLMTFFF